MYVADLYWLFTTVEQTLYSETYPVSVEFLYILYLLNEEKKKTSVAIAEQNAFVRLSGGL